MPGNTRTALVTGATGYVGGRLVARLASDGWRVAALVRPDSALDRLPSNPAVFPLRFGGTTEELVDVVGDVIPDVTFHLATLYVADHQSADVEPLIRSNVLLGTQLAEALTRRGRALLVNTGTHLQRWHSPTYNPGSLYAATKQALEDVLDYYALARGLRAVTLTLFETYGPNDPRPKILNLLRRAAAEGRPLALSPGEQLIDLLHVDDAVRAIATAADRLLAGEGRVHERFSLATDRPVSLRELVDLLAGLTGTAVPVRWAARPYRPYDVLRPWRGGERLPGWRPEIALADGLRALGPAAMS
jgi:nucleoside-diphosphate-sugar epimerase